MMCLDNLIPKITFIKNCQPIVSIVKDLFEFNFFKSRKALLKGLQGSRGVLMWETIFSVKTVVLRNLAGWTSVI